jgi:pimeloyl-ACP methyl ester carboxylesterase
VQALQVAAEQVARVTAPVLTVHGTMDRNAAYGAGREWAMTLPDARLVTVSGAGHCSWADDPERVFGAVETFLSGRWPENAEKVTRLQVQ